MGRGGCEEGGEALVVFWLLGVLYVIHPGPCIPLKEEGDVDYPRHVCPVKQPFEVN